MGAGPPENAPKTRRSAASPDTDKKQIRPGAETDRALDWSEMAPGWNLLSGGFSAREALIPDNQKDTAMVVYRIRFGSKAIYPSAVLLLERSIRWHPCVDQDRAALSCCNQL